MDIKNPFLFDEPMECNSTNAPNPFLNGASSDYAEDPFTGINPFADVIDQNSENPANIFGHDAVINPFGDIPSNIFASGANLPPQTQDILFGDAVFVEKPRDQSNIPLKPATPARPPSPGKPLPPRPPPPTKETKELLQTVIGTLQSTTDTIQNKLKTSISPLTTSGNGKHTSRSPTPDIHITSPEEEPDNFGAVFGQTIELSDTEIEETINTTTSSIVKNVADTETCTKSTDIDLFGETSKPKTAQDILNLYNKPPEISENKIDLLSDDLLSSEFEEKSVFEKKEPNEEIHVVEKSFEEPLKHIEAELSEDEQIKDRQLFDLQERKDSTPISTASEETSRRESTQLDNEVAASFSAGSATENIFQSSIKEEISNQLSNFVTEKVHEPVATKLGEIAASAELFFDTPSTAGTTGATLFETTTVAPNIGMGLFGGGYEASLDIFAESASNTMVNPFAPVPIPSEVTSAAPGASLDHEFDAFSARFEKASTDAKVSTFDPFGGSGNRAASPWGAEDTKTTQQDFGFGDSDQFDAFLNLSEPPPPPQSTPSRVKGEASEYFGDAPMNIVIRNDGTSDYGSTPVPAIAPPTFPLTSDVTRFNPFFGTDSVAPAIPDPPKSFPQQLERSDSQETPPTPLFEEDQSVPLEPYPRTVNDIRTWEMHLRHPNKKKITGQRYWKKVVAKLTENGALQLYNNESDKEPFQELPLQPCYSVSDIGVQQFDQFGKIFTIKLQYIFYKERPGVRPGQISKAERITNKISKFAHSAIAGDYEGVKEFASDVKKLGMPVEHAPQISQLAKLGTTNYEDLKVFSTLVEEYLFKLNVHRDRTLNYKFEEVQLTAVDEMYVEQSKEGAVTIMIARVRIFFLGFICGMPEVDLGINDLKKQGREVVGRHDIIPVVTEEWIRLEDIEFHCTVNKDVFEKTRHIKFQPPDASYIELMRFRVRPPRNRELPLQVKSKFNINGRNIDIFCEILVPGFSGRKLGQVPCEDIALRFPLPESWIYMFRVEKHFRYGSVKSAHRRTGKVKGLERLKGAVENAEAALMEVTSGQAKYEHQHRAIVWRMSRLPKEGQGAYTVHQFTCKMVLTTYDQIPPSFDKYCYLEFTMPATTVSHCVMRSVSITSDEPPEKYVRYLARHEYKIEMEFSTGSAGPGDYIAATKIDKPKPEPVPPPLVEESSSDDSD